MRQCGRASALLVWLASRFLSRRAVLKALEDVAVGLLGQESLL